MKVVFRADASKEIGGGHVMRSLVLAKELIKRGHECTFLATEKSFDLVPLDVANVNKIEISESEFDNTDHIEKLNQDIDIFLIDSYRLSTYYEQKARTVSKLVATIEDIPSKQHNVDVLIDPTFERQSSEYNGLVPSICRLLLGVKYAPLREEFADLRKSLDDRKRDAKKKQRILVSLGLTDSHNDTLKILQGLAPLTDYIETTVVIGKNSDHKSSIEAFKNDNAGFTLLENVENMAQLMIEADIAIGAGGSTCWERCCLKLPSIIVVQEDNQKDIAERLANLGAVIGLGRSVELSPEKIESTVLKVIGNPDLRKSMSEKGSEICDGLGTKRIVDELESLI